MAYAHAEITLCQSPKHDGPCGDHVSVQRTAAATTVVLADGIGSGLKANLAAILCATRLQELMRCGFTLRQAFGRMVKTMKGLRDPQLPFAAFCVARILPDGQFTVLSYEMPEPLLVYPRLATVLSGRTLTLEQAVISESNGQLLSGEGILLFSDGITQAGLGMGLRDGWTSQGVAEFLSSRLGPSLPLTEVPDAVHRQARKLWRTAAGDDCTAVLISCRPGVTLNIMTGPPSNPANDQQVVDRFLQEEGWKVVCGATTAKIVARCIGRDVQVQEDDPSMLAPPRYQIEGIDLVTEGAVTLNQVYNVLDEAAENFEEDSGVTQLHQFLRLADRVHVTLGVAVNPANQSIAFRQRGVLCRAKIMPLLSEKLQAAGKLVVLEYA
jgi:hypothetical protein